jgi:hypothetical protein
MLLKLRTIGIEIPDHEKIAAAENNSDDQKQPTRRNGRRPILGVFSVGHR